jgi:hypothetical protein
MGQRVLTVLPHIATLNTLNRLQLKQYKVPEDCTTNADSHGWENIKSQTSHTFHITEYF